MNSFPHIRLRRLRQTPALRRLLDAGIPGPEKFLWPVFVKSGKDLREPISAMPGQYRMSVDVLLNEVSRVAEMGVGGILIFGLPDADFKDETGEAACADQGIVQHAVRAVRRRFPDLIVATDVCVCAYTRHGHCGPLSPHGGVDNDTALGILVRMALSHAEAGAHIVAPSAMMDGQVMAIREGLLSHGFKDTLLLSYSTKFASAMYGPFRDAGASAPQSGDRCGYQTSYANPRLALRESAYDEAEGADMLMVKPSLFYLDVIAKLRAQTDLPIAVYNVSGEYSMLIAAAERGWGDLQSMVRESTVALVRAGADIIISYWASRYNEVF